MQEVVADLIQLSRSSIEHLTTESGNEEVSEGLAYAEAYARVAALYGDVEAIYHLAHVLISRAECLELMGHGELALPLRVEILTHIDRLADDGDPLATEALESLATSFPDLALEIASDISKRGFGR